MWDFFDVASFKNGTAMLAATMYNIDSVRYNAHNRTAYGFSASAPYATPLINQNVQTGGAFGFSAGVGAGATDTDADNVYAILTDGTLWASTSAGIPLAGFTPNAVGIASTMIVVSTNEH